MASALRLTGLHPEVRTRVQWIFDVADYYGLDADFLSGYRGLNEQTELRRAYETCVADERTRTRCIPANRPGDSAHNFGLAFDSVVRSSVPGIRDWWTALRQYAGFSVPSNDPNHAEVPNWRAYAFGPR